MVGVSFAFAIVAIVIIGALIYQVHHLQKRVADLEPGARNDRLHRTHLDLGEAFLFDITALMDEHEFIRQRMAYYAARAAHVAAGGRPDDDPRTWKNGGEMPESSGGKAQGSRNKAQVKNGKR